MIGSTANENSESPNQRNETHLKENGAESQSPNESGVRRQADLKVVGSLIGNIWIITIISLVAISLIQMSFFGYSFDGLKERAGFVAGISLFFFVAYRLFVIYQTQSKTTKSFVDVDIESKKNQYLTPTYNNEEILKYIDYKISSHSYNSNEETTGKEQIITKSFDAISFKAYFLDIKNVLEEKSRVSDEKASILLDKGTRYARNGIFFYIITIIIWQIAAWVSGGFKPQFIFGIVSCSFMFIFIEFLSAWFLRQYRHFVDTSTYLIKVKSIFDKYLLVVLYAKEDEGKVASDKIFKYLSEEIKWPDINKFTKEDINFAKEALETATTMMKTLKINLQDKRINDSTE